jgi:quercetin dioxygenase-like cupin family protein
MSRFEQVMSSCVLATMVLAGAARPGAAGEGAHVMVTPSAIKWGDAPPVLPSGAKLAVLYGDPGKPELYILRLKMPAGYKIAPHWHPTDENVTVVSGSFAMGMGDKLDAAKVQVLPAGSFAVMPAKTNHYAMAKGETVVEVSGVGPFALTYVNPEDDPSRARASAKR